MIDAHIPFCPACPQCGTSLPYVDAPHAGDCLKAGGQVPSDVLEREVYRSYARWPSHYGRNAWARWRIFDQLFTVNGSGYYWHKGRLTNAPQSKWDDPRPNLRDVRIQPFPDQGAFYNVHLQRQPSHFYLICEYACIATVPDDVHPSFLRACFKVLGMITLIPDCYEKPDGNREPAQRIRAELVARFGEPATATRTP
jgi:hypothetical protein